MNQLLHYGSRGVGGSSPLEFVFWLLFIFCILAVLKKLTTPENKLVEAIEYQKERYLKGEITEGECLQIITELKGI